MTIQTPEWVKHAVFYQIFPDRFARSQTQPVPEGIKFKAWGSPPREQGFQGGSLYGVAEKLDYLRELGITAIYLNPIFSAAANHRYNAYDFMEVDPLLGGEDALRLLLDEAHRRGIRVILDGVFNHCGRGFWAFYHLLENGPASPYADWFTVYGYPLHAFPEPGSHTKPNYACWWNVPDLPKLNTNNPGVREYIYQVTRHWLEFGIDGWRLDVPEEINDDGFWREFRRIVKEVNPEAYIIGEIWHPAQQFLQGDMFDAVMNYVITRPLLGFFGRESLNPWYHPELRLHPMNGVEFSHEIEAMLALYDWQIHFAQLNMLDSHDMPRALWLLGNDKAALRLAVLSQMSMPGAPCVYYGDEVGLSAAGDPDCREAFPWDKPERWDRELLEFYRQAIAMRKAIPALQTGDYHTILSTEKSVVYRRSTDGQTALVAFNAGKAATQLSLPPSALNNFPPEDYHLVWPLGESEPLRQGADGVNLELPAQSVKIWVAGK